MNVKNNIKFYYLSKALRFLLEQGAISQEEYETVCRYNAEIFQPDGGYIRAHP